MPPNDGEERGMLNQLRDKTSRQGKFNQPAKKLFLKPKVVQLFRILLQLFPKLQQEKVCTPS
jgi:hypothetical protein